LFEIFIEKKRMGRSKTYVTIRNLGSGCFGTVDLVKREPPSQNWKTAAMKKIENPGEDSYKEAELLRRQQHPNIVKYYISFLASNTGNLCIVMEFCDRGTLTDLLTQTEVSWKEEFQIWRSINALSSALKYLHKKKILHRDLKPENILLKTEDNFLVLKLADFGIAKLLNQKAQGLYYARDCSMGTPIYMAPEALQHGERYTSSADMWALGAVISFIAKEEHLFYSEYDVRTFDGNRMNYALPRKNISKVLRDLTSNLLSQNPNGRPSAMECFDQSSGRMKKPRR